MQIQVIAVNNQTVPTAKGSYQKLEVTYKDDQGKVGARNIMSFVKESKPAFDILVNATNGEVFDVSMVKQPGKDGKDYWVWTGATKGVAGAKGNSVQSSTGSGSTTVPKGNWETAEERAARQIYIIRQSSISSAVANLTAGAKKAPEAHEVLALAKQFEDFVFKGLTGDIVADTLSLEDPQEFEDVQ